MFLIKNDVVVITECGYLKNDINRLCLGFIIVLMEHKEECFDYVKIEQESIIENNLNQ